MATVLDKLLEQAKRLPPMTHWEKRSQAIDWAVGNLLVDKDPNQYDLWMLRKWAAEAFDRNYLVPMSFLK